MPVKEKNVLIIYSTTDGHCLKISRIIANQLNARTNLISINSKIPDLTAYDGIIIGASIRYGVHRSKVTKYINSHYREIQSKVNAFFSVSLVARKPERKNIETNPYIQKFLKNIKWKPSMISLIAGVLEYPRYSFLDRTMIRLIMKMTHGPTDPSTIIEYTDWEQVEKFAEDFDSQLIQS